MIELTNICKTFRVARRGSGMKSASKALFHREYEKIEALRNVSFTIQDGEMVGYIGPNGAGKSSSIKIMSGILTPDSGTCRINGKTPWKQRKEHVRNIGVVFGQRSQLWWDVPVIDSFELIRDIYSVEPTRYRKNLDTLTTMLSLETILKTPTRQLSLGQRMRCEIAASLSLLAMTRQGGTAMGTVRRTELAVLLPLRGRAGHAPPLQGQCGLNDGRRMIHSSFFSIHYSLFHPSPCGGWQTI